MISITLPSTEGITDQQISTLQGILAEALRGSVLHKDSIQRVIDEHAPAVASNLLSIIKKQVEAIEKVLVFRVTVDRTRLPQTLWRSLNEVGISATYLGGHTSLIRILEEMPRDGENEVDVFLVHFDRFVYPKDLQTELDLYGLKPADPYSLAALMRTNPGLIAEKCLIATQWKNKDGDWCHMEFQSYDNKSSVYADTWDKPESYGYGERYWIACIRK